MFDQLSKPFRDTTTQRAVLLGVSIAAFLVGRKIARNLIR